MRVGAHQRGTVSTDRHGHGEPLLPRRQGRQAEHDAVLIGAVDDGRGRAVEDGLQVRVVREMKFCADVRCVLWEAAASPDPRPIILQHEHGATPHLIFSASPSASLLASLLLCGLLPIFLLREPPSLVVRFAFRFGLGLSCALPLGGVTAYATDSAQRRGVIQG